MAWLQRLLLSALLLPTLAFTAESRTLSIHLLDTKGTAVHIGSLALTPAEQGFNYHLELDHHRFTDHFLSMKEMKCLEGKELWCHLPYPYSNPHQISRTDLRWLEHDLLFLFKRPGEFGADFWNGIYYKLAWQQDRLVGEARALDLNLLASPPDNPAGPPIGEADLDEIDRSQRWLPRIEFH